MMPNDRPGNRQIQLGATISEVMYFMVSAIKDGTRETL
jgi:hypothetical protein